MISEKPLRCLSKDLQKDLKNSFQDVLLRIRLWFFPAEIIKKENM